MPLFGSKDCTKESNSRRYISNDLPCQKILTNKSKSCCKQKDIQFMHDVASIYDSKTSDEEDEQIQGVSSYISEFSSDHATEIDDSPETHIHMATKQGKYMFGLVEKYQSTVPLVIHQENKFKSVPSSIPRVVYIVNGVSKMEVPMHRYVTVSGNKSTANFRGIELFIHDSKSREFEHLLKIIEGNSFLKINIPFVFNESMTDFFLLQDITSSMMKIGRALARNGALDTILHFEFQTSTLHKRLIQVTLGSLGFTDTPAGAIVDEKVPGYTIEVEIREMRGKNVAVILRTFGEKSSLEEKESTSEILDLKATDFISFEEVSIRDYLEQDVRNMVLLEHDNKPHLTNADDLNTSMEEGIVYECKEANERLLQDASNVVSDVELFNARRLGTLPGYIIAEQLRDAMRLSGRDSSRIFYLSKPVKSIPAVISKRVYDGEDDLVSANHCQVGAEGDVFSVLNVKIV